jgi:hypothetical protein
MAKPFKSEFDLMAEAYATVKYDKQQLINEDKAGRRVIGYPPQIVEEGDVNKRIHQDASNGMRKAELEQAYGPEAVEAYISWGHANGVFEGEPFEDAEDKEILKNFRINKFNKDRLFTFDHKRCESF